MTSPSPLKRLLFPLCCLLFPALLSAQLHPHLDHAQVHSAAPTTVSGAHILQLTQQYLAAAPKRFITSPGHDAAENFIKQHFQPEMQHGQFVTDQFYPTTPIGQIPMRNYIVKYPGKRDGIIVLASHYETNYPLRDTGFVGANDGACTTAMLIAIGEYLRANPPQGYSVWLLFDDGEEAVKEWSETDSTYGTRHLAAKWSGDGTLGHIKAFVLADMIGDKDLDILDETQSTAWLREDLKKAAAETHHQTALSKTQGAEEDDHLPFLKRGVPSIDIIDVDYGPHSQKTPDGYHHTAQDTIDKISAKSLQTSADLFIAMIRLINQR